MILQRLSQKLDTFTPRQQIIAKYLLEHYDQAGFMSAEALAEASGVSQPTVARFAQYLGYVSYRDFQAALRIAMRDRMTQAERLQRSRKLPKSKNLFRTFVNSMRFDMLCIEKTIANLDEETVSRTIDLILNARRVYVIGSHAEFCLASYFGCTLGWVREKVTVIDNDFSTTFDSMADVSPEDAAVAYSFPPYPDRTVKLFRYLKQKGARCVAITDSELSPLAEIGDLRFIAHDEKLFFSDNIAGAVSLFSAVLAVVSSLSLPEHNSRMSVQQEFWKTIGFYYKEPDSDE